MKKTFENGKTYITHQYLSFGNYDNSCAVERANVRVLREKHPDFESYSFSDWDRGRELRGGRGSCTWDDICPESEIVELYGGYGTIQIWIREDVDEENGYLVALENTQSLTTKHKKCSSGPGTDARPRRLPGAYLKTRNSTGEAMTCIVLDPKGSGMVRYKGQNYCLFSTVEAARFDVQNNYPHSMQSDFDVIDWHQVTP